MLFVYFCILLLAFAWYSSFARDKKKYACLVAFVLFLIAFLKSVNFGSDDLLFYYKYYNSLANMSYEYIRALGKSGRLKDAGFFIVAKVFADLGVSDQLWIGLIGLLFGVSIAVIIYKYSRHGFLSVLMIFALSYLSFSLTGIRQTVAFALTIIAYTYAKEKKIILFFSLVVLASIFHSAALVFLIAYFLPRKSIPQKTWFVIILTQIIISVFIPSSFRRMIQVIGWNDPLISYSTVSRSLSWAGFIIQLSIFIFCLYYGRSGFANEKEACFDINLMAIGLVFQAYAAVVAEMFRVSMFFSVFGIIAVPYSLSAMVDLRKRKQMTTTIIIVLLLYMIYTKAFSGYEFFWRT